MPGKRPLNPGKWEPHLLAMIQSFLIRKNRVKTEMKKREANLRWEIR